MQRSITNKHGDFIGYIIFDKCSTTYDQKKAIDVLTDFGMNVEYCQIPNLTFEESKIRSHPEYVKSRKICFDTLASGGHMTYNIISLTLSALKEKLGEASIQLIRRELPELESHIRF